MTRVPRVDTARRIFSYTADTVAIFFAGLLALQKLIVSVVGDQIELWRSLAAGLCLAGIHVFFWRIHRAVWRDRPAPSREILLSGLLAVAAVGFNPFGGEFVAIIWFMGAVLHLPRRPAAGLAAVVVLAPIGYFPVVYEEVRGWPMFLLNLVLMAAWTTVLAGLMLALRWLWWVTREFHAGQEARARLAVSEERLRFARDLHDLLGHSLAVIALKSELAAKVGDRGPRRAIEEMRAVRELAAGSLKEVRAAVRGFRSLDLDEEILAMRAVLEAAGIRCAVEADLDGLSSERRTLIAWAIREGVTNILKHSTATRCLIKINEGVLEIRNDGVDGDLAPGGSGLLGLSERMASMGGSLSASATGTGEFLLRAALPT